MRILAFVALALVGASLTAQARLGETREQIEKRYGKPNMHGQYGSKDADNDTGGGFMREYINVEFKNGKSVAETLFSNGLSSSVRNAFLEANKGDSSWEPGVTLWVGAPSTYKRKDGLADACADKDWIRVRFTEGGSKGF